MLLAVAVAGLGLRLIALLGPGGPIAAPTGYDDGVYYSASALLFGGVLPYRDFVFVHPPGVLYFYGLAWSFAAARVLATIVGAINIVLAGRIVMRAAGPLGGLVAAVLYATYPEAVTAERSAYLEPVLNLACLGMAYVWLSPRESKRTPMVAGVLCGAACAVKVLGGIWFLAALAAAPRRRFRSDVARFIAAGAASGLLLLAPLALTNLPGFVKQTLFFHSARPPDGILDPLERVRAMFDSGHLAASVLALIAVIAIVLFAIRDASRITREERFFAVATLLTVAAFLASSSYWMEYNSHLAASQCVLAGLVAASLQRLPRIPRRTLSVALVLFIAVVQLPSLRRIVNGSRANAPELIAVGKSIRANVPAGDCVFAFDPTWTLAGGRLPPHGDGAPSVVDSYGAMLLDSIDDGTRFADAGQAFQREDAQRDVRARLEACRFAVLGPRGSWQLNAANRDWFRANYICVEPVAGELCVSRRLASAHTGLARVANGQSAQFGDGWYGEEGGPPSPRRWMGARSVTTLPPIRGQAWLQLSFYVPADSGTPTITIALDGRVLDQIAATGDVIRAYDVDVTGDAPHALVLTTDRTFNPSRSGGSSDMRDLGLQVSRIIWLSRDDAASMSSTR